MLDDTQYWTITDTAIQQPVDEKKNRLGSDASLHLTSYNQVSVGKALSLKGVLHCKRLYL